MVLGWDGSRGKALGVWMTDFCAWERGLRLGTGEMMGHESGELVGGHETECVHKQLGQLGVAGPALVRE
jgi:hypothetical protein